MKKHITLLVLFIALISSLSYGQESPKNAYSKQLPENFNLPPGSKFLIKKYEQIDYSYKLNGGYTNESITKNYLSKFSSVELEKLKTSKPTVYQYYQKANNYFLGLSNKVKKAFSVSELWYVYMYDNKLKSKLTNIK